MLKKDEKNEYKKKKKHKKQKKRQKEERTRVPRPLSWNIYAKKQCLHINRAGYNNVCELIDCLRSSILTFLYMRLS
jgi:predicted ATPase